MLVDMTSLRDDIRPGRMIKQSATRTCQDVRLARARHAIQFGPFGEHLIGRSICRRCVSSTSERSRRRYYCPSRPRSWRSTSSEKNAFPGPWLRRPRTNFFPHGGSTSEYAQPMASWPEVVSPIRYVVNRRGHHEQCVGAIESSYQGFGLYGLGAIYETRDQNRDICLGSVIRLVQSCYSPPPPWSCWG